MNVYITEDEVLGINLVDEDYYYLDLVIKQNPKDKEFIPFVIIFFFYTTINLHFTSRKNIDKQNYTIARYQYTGKYLGV